MLGAAGYAQNFLAAVAGFGPHRAALARAMHDPVRHAAQRYDCASLERRRLRQTAETRGDPAAMKPRKVLCFHERAARRHGQDGFTVGWMNAQGVTARAAMPAQPDRKDLRAVLDQKSRGFGGPPIKEGASSHVLESGEQEYTRILPYPPPGKSHLNCSAQKQIICPIYRGFPENGL
jgi:hypothetical protein